MTFRLSKSRYRIPSVMGVGLCALLANQACSSGESEPSSAPAATDASLTDSSSTAPAENSGVDCQNPSRFFKCSGEGCCAEEPTCGAGQLPFSDVCGCGCLAAACQPGNRNYTTTSPHECSTGTRPQCQREIEAPFDDECGCGCTDLVNLPAACDESDRDYVCKGYQCCVGANLPACPDGTQSFEDTCGCGCMTPPSSCDRPNRTFICSGDDCCVGIDFICPAGTRGFDNTCGCGCQP